MRPEERKAMRERYTNAPGIGADIHACLDALDEAEKRSKLFEDCLIGINTAVGDEPPEDTSDPAYCDYLMRVKIALADKDKCISELEAVALTAVEALEGYQDKHAVSFRDGSTVVHIGKPAQAALASIRKTLGIKETPDGQA